MSTAIPQLASDNGGMDLEAVRGPIAQMVAPGASKAQLVRALLMVSYASLFVGVNAAIHQPAAAGSVFAGHLAAYYSIVATVLVAVPVQMSTAFLLRRSNGQGFLTFAQVLQRVGVVLLIIVSAVGGFELTVKA